MAIDKGNTFSSRLHSDASTSGTAEEKNEFADSYNLKNVSRTRNGSRKITNQTSGTRKKKLNVEIETTEV